jgi:hypothetical protein
MQHIQQATQMVAVLHNPATFLAAKVAAIHLQYLLVAD